MAATASTKTIATAMPAIFAPDRELEDFEFDDGGTGLWFFGGGGGVYGGGGGACCLIWFPW